MDIYNSLIDYGLSQKEAKIYIALLQIGQSKVAKIAKKSGIVRETTYFTLDSLANKGLVSHVIKSGIKFFEAAHPSKFNELIEDKQNTINKALPRLKEIMNTITKETKVEVYEGKEGIKTILDCIINENAPLFAYANSDVFTFLRFSFPKFVNRRVKAKIKARIIQEKSSLLQTYKKSDKKEIRQMRFCDNKFSSNVFIFGNNVAFITLDKEPTGILIHNEMIAKTQKQVFNVLWKMTLS